LAAGDLALTEGATNATAYTVALNAQPASDVVIDISEADQLLTFTINDAGSDNDFDALADQTRNVDITDNDTPGFTILAAGDLALTEGATNATAYTVALNAQPASDVVIDISESSSAVTLNTAQLTFTSVNWATPQNVSVTGTEDPNLISEADQLLTFTINDAGSDNDFDALADQTRNVDITDNDTPGFTILAAGDLALTEGATNATAYTVALNAQPASDVVIDISESSSAVTLNTAQLTFTSVNWATPQNVSVTGTEDANLISEADQLLTFTINDAGSDNDFDALADQTRNVDITDNDTPGFTILAAGDLALTEGATNATAYTVALNAQPASDVVIDISESSSAVTLNTAQLTFTSVNWNTPQNVSVTGTEDPNLISEADQLLTFTVNDAGSDNDFDALADQTRNVDITDNDTPGFTILAAGDLALTEGATNATAYTVALNAQPASDVVIDISESSSAVTLNTAQLTFTSVNWNTPQNVSVTGTEDPNLISEADQLLTFTINDAGSDNDFDALADQTRNVDITDNDTPGFTILAAGDLALTEGATNATAYTVALNAQPASDVVIDISESSSAVTLNTAQLTFTSSELELHHRMYQLQEQKTRTLYLKQTSSSHSPSMMQEVTTILMHLLIRHVM
jgi:predicted 2-oxoglutarate/Fe(II)-dependent dioxygenase YbiX